MPLNVKFSREDRLKLRVYYQGIDEEKNNTYCVENGKWLLCDKNGEPEKPLHKRLKIIVHDASGIIGSTTIKK